MFASIALLFTLAASALSADLLSVNNPKAVTECAPVTITWQDGKGPYFLSVVPGDSPCDEALIEFPENKDTWLNWKAANLTAGTSVIFALEDSTGEEVWTSKFTVKSGNTTDCHEPATSSSSSSDRTTIVANAGANPTGSASSSSGSSSDGTINPGGAISGATRHGLQAILALGAVVMGSTLLL